MNTHETAIKLAERPYLRMTSSDLDTDENPIYFARVLEIEGCFGQGNTQEEAIENLQEAMVDFIESLINDGLRVPEPANVPSTSGAQKEITYVFKMEGHNLLSRVSESKEEIYLLSAQR